ncbi:MAG: cupin domain-containing protein [Pseudomonadota bacterium]
MTGAPLTAEAVDRAAFDFTHPLEPSAGCQIAPISRLAGLERSALNLVRIAPGGQAFPEHLHHNEEEWVYVIGGVGEVLLDGEPHPLGPGSFVAFAPGGPSHAVRNTGADEMVCLMGSDKAPADVIDFPGLGHRVVRTGQSFEGADMSAFRPVFPGAPPGPEESP